MEEYLQISFGAHKGTPVNEIPMDYLIWIFPKLRFWESRQDLYRSILKYFLSKDIRVENHTGVSQGWHFYFNDYVNPRVGGGERPFIQSFWRMKNSNSDFVYEVGNGKYPLYIEEKNGKFEISDKYVGANYKYGGLKMVYERNPYYYFFDGYGLVFKGAYLMRKPWVPELSLSGDFSENLPIENLK